MADEFELGTDGPKAILVGVDGSRTSMRAAAYAAGLARRQDALLVVLYVRTNSALAGLNPQAGGLYRQTQGDIAADLERELVGAARPLGVRAEFVEAEGDAYERLVHEAEERRVDAVVVGASEHAGHRLVGSLASRLVRTARWPVTVVP